MINKSDAEDNERGTRSPEGGLTERSGEGAPTGAFAARKWSEATFNPSCATIRQAHGKPFRLYWA